MKGNTINEFISDLFNNPEKEIVYHNSNYMVCGFVDKYENKYTLEVYTIAKKPTTLFTYTSSNRQECVGAFEDAKIFDGKTIYEAENDIEVLFG